MTVNVLILAAAQTTNEQDSAPYPLCLTEINGVSLLECIVNNTANIKDTHFTFAFNNNDMQKFHLGKVAKLLAPNSVITEVRGTTRGSACTALLAACSLPSDEELLIVCANELVDCDLEEVISDFRYRDLQAGTITFRSLHPRYSYVRLDLDGHISEAAQKKPISNHATAGIFWFSKTGDYVNAAKQLIRKNECTDNAFYIAPTLNELILEQARIGVFNIPTDCYKPLKTERQIQNFEQRH